MHFKSDIQHLRLTLSSRTLLGCWPSSWINLQLHPKGQPADKKRNPPNETQPHILFYMAARVSYQMHDM